MAKIFYYTKNIIKQGLFDTVTINFYVQDIYADKNSYHFNYIMLEIVKIKGMKNIVYCKPYCSTVWRFSFLYILTKHSAGYLLLMSSLSNHLIIW